MTAPIKIMVVDDERPARERLTRLLNQFPHLQLVAEAENGEQALQKVASYNPQLIFLDISMPVMNGMQVANILSEQYPHIKIIFTTAYDEYALQAFEVNAQDYLLKPIRQERLQSALKKLQVSEPSEPYITVKDREITHKILLKDIVFLQADQKYTEVHLAHHCYLTGDSLKDLETRFEHVFIRLHRSILVNRQQLIGLEKSQDQLLARLKDSDQKLEISRRHQASIRQFLKDQ